MTDLYKDKDLHVLNNDSQTQLLVQVFNLLEFPLYVIDVADFSLILANQSALRIRDKGWFLRCTREDCTKTDEHCHMSQCLARVAARKKKTLSKNVTFFDDDGIRRCFDVYSQPVIMQGRGNSLVIEYLLDQTERKMSEEERHWLAKAVEQATDSIVITKTDGTIEYVNPAFEKITGYTFDEAVGQNPRLLKSPEAKYPQTYYQDMWNQLNLGNVWRGEFINRKKNGEDYFESASIFPIRNEKGELIRLGAVKTDITERKKLEQELRNSLDQVLILKDEAESANRMKSRFLAAMSHDIRTPLNGILGFADLIENQAGNEKLMGYASRIKTAGNTLLSLINDILDFSKIESGQLDMYYQVFPVTDLMDDILSLFEFQFKEKKLKLKVEADPAVPEYLKTDRGKLQQIIVNLLSNSLKFTKSGHVHCYVTVENRNNKRHDLVIIVQDTGIGIDLENVQKIFDAFVRVDKVEEERIPGTGLGLAICQHLTSLLDGHISVRSVPGKGTTFTVTIPLLTVTEDEKKSATVQEKTSYAHLPVSLRSKKLMIVEDNEINREVLVEKLKEAGFNSMRTFSNGQDGVENVAKVQPDCILMDIEMPGLNGLQAIELLRSRGVKIPIIALSAYAQESDRQNAVRAGADSYLTKPLDFQALKLLLLHYLSSDTQKNQQGPGPVDSSEESLDLSTVSPRMRALLHKDIPQKLKQIEAFLATPENTAEREQLERLVHTYKGNARYYSLNNLEKLSTEVHQLCKTLSPIESITIKVKDLQAELKKIYHHLKTAI